MGLISDFFGLSDKQVVEDIKQGNASARSDAEVTAKADWMVDDVNDSSPPPGSK